ncbi:hypothetical protein [Nocardioides kribbensis]|uniref:XkdX family protein n=1 Tax=Nocardioides kribbensis TaxID=305517 RepID=A0ABV1NYW7_9ACTN
MATAIGQRYLVRYYEADEQGRADLLPMLNTCKTRGYITAAEYDRAIAGEEPIGYMPSPQSTEV